MNTVSRYYGVLVQLTPAIISHILQNQKAAAAILCKLINSACSDSTVHTVHVNAARNICETNNRERVKDKRQKTKEKSTGSDGVLVVVTVGRPGGRPSASRQALAKASISISAQAFLCPTHRVLDPEPCGPAAGGATGPIMVLSRLSTTQLTCTQLTDKATQLIVPHLAAFQLFVQRSSIYYHVSHCIPLSIIAIFCLKPPALLP